MVEVLTGTRIYITNNAGTISKRTLSDELLHAENQRHHSLWNQHILTQTGVTSIATQTSPDEMYIKDMNQTLKLGEDWTKHIDTIRANVDTVSFLTVINYLPGWNMASVPTLEPNMAASAVFPEKSGSAFKYQGGYVAADTLENAKGYWIKLPNAIEKEFSGTPVELDTIEVDNRWNIVGGIGYPVPKDSIEQIPPGILVSNYYGYLHGYVQTDTIQPGKAYWVKSSQPGKIIIKKTVK